MHSHLANVGDVRSLPLLEAFHASVEISRAQPDLPVHDLRRRISESIAGESELVVAPAFFRALLGAIPQIRGAEVIPKRGDHENELTRYRYDAILETSIGEDPQPDVSWIDWGAERRSASELRRMLAEEGPEVLGQTALAAVFEAVDGGAKRSGVGARPTQRKAAGERHGLAEVTAGHAEPRPRVAAAGAPRNEQDVADGIIQLLHGEGAIGNILLQRLQEVGM